MTDTTVEASEMRSGDLAQMELTQTVDGLAAVLDAIVKAGYLDALSTKVKGVDQLIALIDVCEVQAQRACKLSRRCEEFRARMTASP